MPFRRTVTTDSCRPCAAAAADCARRWHRGKLGLCLLVLALLGQVLVGISTLLLHVPVWLAACHQGGAILLLSAVVFVSHNLVRSKRIS